MKKKLLAVTAATTATLLSISAQAAYTLPTAVSGAFSDYGDAWEAIEAQIWPILVSVTIGFFVIRMFRKGSGKIG